MFTRGIYFIATLSLVCAIATGGLLSFVLFTISTSGEELEKQTTLIANNNAKETVVNNVLQSITLTTTEREQLQSFVLTEDQTGSFLNDIEQLGRKQGVVLATESLEVKKVSEFFNQLIIKFSVTGEDSRVLHMISILETLPYYSQMTSLAINRESTESTRGTVELQVTLLKK